MTGLNFNYDAYNMLDVPDIYLAYPNKRKIGLIHGFDRQNDFYFNNHSTLELTVYKYTDGNPTPYYEDISIGRYLYLEGITWFRIVDVEESGTGINTETKITAYTLEYELTETYITSMGDMGVETDEMGGLDLYCFNNPSDPEHSIRHLVEAQNPAWHFDYIDPDIPNDYRSYSEDRISTYDLLTDAVAEALECIFLFDGNTRSISAYTLENIGTRTGIYLSLQNLLEEIKVTWDESDIRTVFYVTGGDDTTGTPLIISDINPTGNNYISNFGYYYKDMSPELLERLIEYNEAVIANQTAYSNALSELATLYDELGRLNNLVPDDTDSTDWSQWGLTQLKTLRNQYMELMSLYADSINDSTTAKNNYDKYCELYNSVDAAVTQREAEVAAKEAEIEKQFEKVESYTVNMQDFLGEELYEELSLFVKEDVYNDSTFIVTDIMTDSEIMDMKESLMEHAMNELERVAYPRFEMTVDAINFPTIFRYKEYTDQLDLGNIVYINYAEDVTLEARVLMIHYNWDDRSDFKMTFSNSTSLEDGYFELADILNQSESMSRELDLRYIGYTSAANKTQELDEYLSMSEFMDASVREITNNATNQEILMNSSGILVRKAKEDGSGYEADKMWITSANILLYSDEDETQLKTPRVAIGRVSFEHNNKSYVEYGVAADVIYGHLLWGESLYITNASNTFTMDENGLVAKSSNGFSVTINPDDPSNIFTIANGNTKLLYVDVASSPAKLVFQGVIECDEGHIGGWTINSNSLYSDYVGLCSSSGSSTVAIWAGGSSASAAAFTVTNSGNLTIGDKFQVTNDGTMHCSNVVITGGSLKIGNNFEVTSDGDLTARNAKFSGEITSTNSHKSTIEIGCLEVDDDGIQLGDFYVSADSSYTMKSTDGRYISLSILYGPTMNYGELILGSDETAKTDISAYSMSMTGALTCARIYGTDGYVSGHAEASVSELYDIVLSANMDGGSYKSGDWWEGWSVTRTVINLWNRVKNIENELDL